MAPTAMKSSRHQHEHHLLEELALSALELEPKYHRTYGKRSAALLAAELAALVQELVLELP
jgi:hypothetical protein